MSEMHYESATGLMSRLDAREIGARELLESLPRPHRAAQPGDQRDRLAGRPTARGRKPTHRTGAARRGSRPAPWTACR